MKTRMRQLGLFLVVVLFMNVASAQTGQHGWRGPTRDGIYPETGLLKSWPESGPQQLWETLDAGKGYSSPVIVGERLYITGMNTNENGEIFSAYTLDGKKVYEVEYGKPWTDSYPETRTTPAIVGDKAYVISGSGEIVCLNTANGSIVWKVDGGTVFARKTGNWGTSECPLVFDNKVIYTPSGDQTTMVALNAQNGEVVWKTRALGDTGAYVSPLLITYNGKRQIVGSTSANVFGVNPETGEIEWTFNNWRSEPMTANRPTWVSIAPNTPLFKEGKIYFSHGYDIGGYMIQLNNTMTGATLLWKTDAMDTHHGGYVLVDGVIYGSNWLNNNSGNWVGIDWNTGQTKFETTWDTNGKGSIIAADGMLIAYDERRGTVGLVKPGTDKFDIISEFRITKGEGPHWAHPVINNGILYIRHGNALMAYKVK